MTIQHIYDQYRLMPNLQIHQYRVAGVAKLVCGAIPDQVDTNEVIQASLLHDMGNMIKFDLGRFPEFLEPQGLVYWMKVQKEFKKKYGMDEHQATFAIAREVGVSDRVFELISAVGFDEIKDDFNSGDLSKMICEYADCRVSPMGVVSLDERLADLEKRYADHYPSPEHTAKRREFQKWARKMEAHIFERCKLKPEEITEEKVAQTFDDLKQLEIK